jgi:hypothetical protein
VGEGRTESGVDQAVTDQAAGRKLTVPEAAEALVISADAVRSRIKRGTLATVREGGRVFVVLGAVDRPTDRALPTNLPSPDLLYQEMQERIRYLETQVEEEREARRRADTLLARLMDRLPELEAPSESPAADESGAPETATDEAEIAQEDPEQEARLEANKIQAEGAKTQVAVAGGSLVGIAAIVGFLPTQHGAIWLLGALFAIFVSLASGLMYISHIAEETAAQRYAPDSFVVYWARFLLPAGLTALALYVMLNLPFWNSEGDRIPVGDVRLVVFWAFLGVGAFLTTYTLKGWVLRRRTRRRSEQEDTAAR